MVLPFMSIYLNQEMQLNLSQCGIVMACYGLGSVAGAFTGGFLTDLWGYYKVMILSLFSTAAAFIAVMYLDSYLWLCLGFFSISFLADNFRPANLTAIEAFSKPENLTRSIGLIRLAINLGYAFGPFLGGYIAAILGYNFLFIFNGISVFMAGIVFYLFFRNKKKSLDRDEKLEVEIRKMPWQDLPYLVYLILFGMMIVVFFQLIYVVPLYYKTAFGFDESIVGLLMGLNGLMIFLIEMPLIFWIERYFRPVSLVAIGGFLIGASVLCLAVINTPMIAAMSFIILITLGEILSFPFSNTFALRFTNDRNRGRYMGFYTMTFSAAHVIAPLVWFKMADASGFDMIWYIGFVVCIIASGLVLMYRLRMP